MRIKRGFVSRRRHKKIMKLASGFRGRRKNCFKLAKDAVGKSLQFSYRDRKVRKRDFRRLWTIRINAAARASGMSYSKFIRGMRLANLEINRKMLAELAANDPAAFAGLVERARAAL